ncbi:MAG TPA: DUF1499 domain-containing protein [Candidatus Binataceae bacterium]|nr:DUF1499 domain-containing protein [Candidatus Binataceae bacterium]
MTVAWLAFFDALLAIVLVTVGMLGAHLYYLAPFVGFQLFVFGFLIALVTIILGIIGMLMTRAPERRGPHNRARFGLIIGAVIALPIFLTLARGGKYIVNDITTDTDNPPEFSKNAGLVFNQGFDLKYNKNKYAAGQERIYGVIAPLKEKDPPAAMFAKLKDLAAANPNWIITETDPNTMTIEGVATSRLFHFPDNFIIQVRPSSDGGSLIEMRSKSRYGVGDFGVNYRRIHNFFDRVALARDSGEEAVP